MKTTKFQVRNIVRRILAMFIDFTLVFSLTICIDRIIKLMIWIPFPATFILCGLLYYCILLTKCKYTVGNALFGLYLSFPDTPHANRKIIFRCIGESLLLWAIPVAAAAILLRVNSLHFYYVLIIIVSYYVVMGVVSLILKTPVWNLRLKAQYVSKRQSVGKQLLLSAVTLTAFILCIGFMLCYNNCGNPSDKKLLGFKQPMKLKEHPSGPWLNKYTSFLEQQQDAKSYLLDLFNKYDIVILMENYHDGTPEWDFIYDVVSDSTFIHKVGHVFTEYGGQKYQSEVDTFLMTRFDSDTAIEKRVAEIWGYRPFGYSFSNFLKRINKLNATLPDSLKIREHFTAWDDGKYFTAIDYDTVKRNFTYDSSMAKVVLDWYNKTKGKCLVVTNTIHSWALRNNHNATEAQKEFYNQFETAMIYKQVPQKTASVYYYHQHLIDKGKWRSAFKATSCRPVGFNLNNTIFGRTEWVRYPSFFLHSKLKFEDIYTGMIFNTLDEDCITIKWGNNYAQHGVLHEYSEAIRRGDIDSSTLLTGSVYLESPGVVKPTFTIDDILKDYEPRKLSALSIGFIWLNCTGAAIDFLLLLPLMALVVLIVFVRCLVFFICQRKL